MTNYFSLMTMRPVVYRYHSLSCVCEYCLAMDHGLVQEWRAEIKFMKHPIGWTVSR
jgi:hypothetical protein